MLQISYTIITHSACDVKLGEKMEVNYYDVFRIYRTNEI
nr:MAG TPA: hypothetical protein [Caudoviricetes sp.]